MPATAPPRRIEFTTWDPAEAREFLDRAYGARLQVGASWDTSVPFTVTQVTAGEITAAELSIPADLTFKVDGRDQVIINTIASGTICRHRAKATDRYQPGDVYLSVYPEADWTCQSHESRLSTAVLPAALLASVASADPDRPSVPVEFLSFSPVQGRVRRWRETSRFVGGLLADPDAASPLVIGAAARLLAATALTVFANTAVTGPTPADSRDAQPETVRRAVSFIEASADRDITLADIAAAAHVTTRAVQLAFRRNLDTTPMAYLRRVRLDLAHRQLEAADPATETVSAVAYQWGFSSPSRFAGYYRDAYGVPPSRTLQS